MSFRKKYKVKNHPKTIASNQITPTPKKGISIVDFIKKFWFVIGIIGVLIGLFCNLQQIKQLFLSPKEKFEAEKTIQGDLNIKQIPKSTDTIKLSENGDYSVLAIKFPTVSFKNQNRNPPIKGLYIKDFKRFWYINFFLGGKLIRVFTTDLSKGISISNPLFKGCIDQKIDLFVVNDSLYVSTQFKDLEKEEVVGYIDFNHWVLYKDNMLDFNNDDKRLEVVDKQKHIIFSIRYNRIELGREFSEVAPMVMIAGYFISNTSILVIPNTNRNGQYVCIDKQAQDWKSKSIPFIDSIKTIFN